MTGLESLSTVSGTQSRKAIPFPIYWKLFGLKEHVVLQENRTIRQSLCDVSDSVEVHKIPWTEKLMIDVV